MSESLIELIYESAFVPELWTKVLDQLAGIAGARGGALYLPGPAGLQCAVSEGLQELVTDYIVGDWAGRTKRRARINSSAFKGFVGDRQLFSQEEIELDPIYKEFLRPRGFGWAAAATLPAGGDRTVILGLERDYVRGHVEASALDQLNELYPHLVRSSIVASRLRLERARLATETLSLLGLPALIIDFNGRVLAANDLAVALNDFVRWLAKDRIALKDRRAEASLKQSLKRLLSGADIAKHSFPACAPECHGLMVVHVLPIRGMARDVFDAGSAMIVLSPLGAARTPSIGLIRSIFGLTPQEARIAQGLVLGATLDELAAKGGVSRNTVRTQLRAVLEKTGCKRQAEVIALLSRLNISAA
jgi:DNA-binding CsgD family transcriptional regulator